MYKDIVQTLKGDNNKMYSELFLPYDILAYKDGKQYHFSIKMRDLYRQPDCKIGDIENNVWYRPAAATRKGWTGYKSYANLSRAVKNLLRKYGYDVVGYYEAET